MRFLKRTVKMTQKASPKRILRRLPNLAGTLWKTSAPNLPNFARRAGKMLDAGRKEYTAVAAAAGGTDCAGHLPGSVPAGGRTEKLTRTFGSFVEDFA